jgi:hypothetical protein
MFFCFLVEHFLSLLNPKLENNNDKASGQGALDLGNPSPMEQKNNDQAPKPV